MFWVNKLLHVLFSYLMFSAVHDVLAKKIYCKWKKKHNNGRKCYYWDCSEWHICPYNGERTRLPDWYGRKNG